MILVDTSGILSAVDPRQDHHTAAAAVLLWPDVRILSPFVLAELDYLTVRNGGLREELKLLRDVARRAYELAPFSSTDMEVAVSLIEQYRDLRLGLADASIMVLAERYRCHDILTLDERHFRAVLAWDGQPFRLLPADASDG